MGKETSRENVDVYHMLYQYLQNFYTSLQHSTKMSKKLQSTPATARLWWCESTKTSPANSIEQLRRSASPSLPLPSSAVAPSLPPEHKSHFSISLLLLPCTSVEAAAPISFRPPRIAAAMRSCRCLALQNLWAFLRAIGISEIKLRTEQSNF